MAERLVWTLDSVLCPSAVWKNKLKIKMQASVDGFVLCVL